MQAVLEKQITNPALGGCGRGGHHITQRHRRLEVVERSQKDDRNCSHFLLFIALISPLAKTNKNKALILLL